MNDPFPQAVSAAPDAIEPIVGWRGWSLRMQDGRLELGAVFNDAVPWPARMAMHAECGVRPLRKHRTPDEGCTCGIYAARRPMSLVGPQTVFRGHAAAVGTVALWGKVVEHVGGFRAEFAYPDRLRLVCRRCAVQGLSGAIATVIELERGELFPVCREHDASSFPRPRHPVDEIERKLLATYAVDLLSLESLREASFRPMRSTPTVADVTTLARRRLRDARTWWAVFPFLLLFLLLRSLGALGPERAPSPDTSPPRSARVSAIRLAYPIARDQVLHGLGLPEVTRPRVGGFAFVCAKEVAFGMASLARCGGPASFAGLASWPAITDRRCGSRQALTWRRGFSVCWIRLEGERFSSPELRLPGVRWRDLAKELT